MSLLHALALAATSFPTPEAEIRAELDQWVAAYNGRDLEGVMKVWDPAIRGWYPGFAANGLADTRAQYSAITRPGFDGTMCLDIVDIDVESGLAYVHDLWTVRSGSRSEVVRSFEIWRLNEAGDWRITNWISYTEPDPGRIEGRTCSA